MSTPRVAAIHDLSGFGRCSLTIVQPTLSAMGVQCCPLPTAYLSTHTGGFGENTFLDLTDQMAPVTAHWHSLGLRFDGIYTGFMGSREQISLTADFIRTFHSAGTTVLVDPVMGDHGRAYRTYTPEMCRAMGDLAVLADVITPNPTEAAILLGEAYTALRLDDEEACRRLAWALSLDGRRSVALTGVAPKKGMVGAVCFDRETGETTFALQPEVAGQFHGSGDLFASVLAGDLARGEGLARSAERAAWFTSMCIRRTGELGLPEREGLDLEPLLWRLGRSTVEDSEPFPRCESGGAGL